MVVSIDDRPLVERFIRVCSSLSFAFVGCSTHAIHEIDFQSDNQSVDVIQMDLMGDCDNSKNADSCDGTDEWPNIDCGAFDIHGSETDGVTSLAIRFAPYAGLYPDANQATVRLFRKDSSGHPNCSDLQLDALPMAAMVIEPFGVDEERVVLVPPHMFDRSYVVFGATETGIPYDSPSGRSRACNDDVVIRKGSSVSLRMVLEDESNECPFVDDWLYAGRLINLRVASSTELFRCPDVSGDEIGDAALSPTVAGEIWELLGSPSTSDGYDFVMELNISDSGLDVEGRVLLAYPSSSEDNAVLIDPISFGPYYCPSSSVWNFAGTRVEDVLTIKPNQARIPLPFVWPRWPLPVRDMRMSGRLVVPNAGELTLSDGTISGSLRKSDWDNMLATAKPICAILPFVAGCDLPSWDSLFGVSSDIHFDIETGGDAISFCFLFDVVPVKIAGQVGCELSGVDSSTGLPWTKSRCRDAFPWSLDTCTQTGACVFTPNAMCPASEMVCDDLNGNTLDCEDLEQSLCVYLPK